MGWFKKENVGEQDASEGGEGTSADCCRRAEYPYGWSPGQPPPPPYWPGYAPGPGQPYPTPGPPYPPGAQQFAQPVHYQPQGQGQPHQGYPSTPFNPAVCPGQITPILFGQPIMLFPPPPPPLPPPLPGCPIGLEQLTLPDQVFIISQKEESLVLEEKTDCYTVLNKHNERLFYARKESRGCSGFFCGPHGSTKLVVRDNWGRVAMVIDRQWKCSRIFTCSACTRDQFSVSDGSGNTMGIVQQQKSCCKPKYFLLDADSSPKFKMMGPCCPCCSVIKKDFNFHILVHGTTSPVGYIAMNWSGLVEEESAPTRAYKFGVSFPQDLHVELKASLVGAAFFIGFMYYDN